MNPPPSGGGNINPSDILGGNSTGPPTDSSWRTPEKRQLVIRKIAETVKMFPDVLARNPADVETSIFQRARSEHDYMNMVGKIVLSIRQKGLMQQQQQQAQQQVPHQPQWVPPGTGMGPPPHGGMEWPGMRPMAPQPNTGYPSFAPMGPYGPPPPQPGVARMMSPYNPQQMHHMGGGMAPPHHVMPPRPAPYIVRNIPPPTATQRATGLQQMSGSGEHIVSAVPNPSFPAPNTMERPPGAPSPYPTPPTNNQQANSPKHTSAQSPRAPPLPSPNTPWNPNSPSGPVPSPNTSTGGNNVTPEANAAVLIKLQELQPYIPLLARMIDRLARGDKDKARSDQLTKLTSLYNVLQSKNMKVSLQTLEKCHIALKRIFEKDQPPQSVAVPPPSVPVTSAPSEATPPRPPVPPTPPISSMSLHDFKIIHSPPPLSSYLQPVLDNCDDPLERLSPSKRRKLNDQASKSFLSGIKRELNHLTQFDIKQIPAPNSTDMDGSLTLQFDDSLPSVPPLVITLPSDYPTTAPHCIINEATSSFVQSVNELLKEKLSQCSGPHYTLSYALKTWESSLLQVIAKELRQND